MIVSELMTRKPARVNTDETLSAAVQIMWEADCGAVPVVQDDAGKLVGIITDRDICIASWSRGLAPNAIFVGEVMSRNPVTCGPNDSIAHASETMQNKQIRRIPVVDSERHLIGMLSLADIARVTSDRKTSERDVSSSGLASTLAAISRSPASSNAGRIAV
jgi:CBS domain-containing protein